MIEILEKHRRPLRALINKSLRRHKAATACPRVFFGERYEAFGEEILWEGIPAIKVEVTIANMEGSGGRAIELITQLIENYLELKLFRMDDPVLLRKGNHEIGFIFLLPSLPLEEHMTISQNKGMFE